MRMVVEPDDSLFARLAALRPQTLGNAGRLTREIVRQRMSGPELNDFGAVLQLDQRQAIADREHQDGVRRLRSAVGVGALIWPAIGLVDWFVSHGDPALLHWLLAVRAAGWPLIVGVWIVLATARNLSPLAVRLLDGVVFNVSCVFVGAMCLRFGGIESRYSTGLLLVILVRATSNAEPWRRGLPMYLFMWFTFPAFMWSASLVDPAIAAQFGKPASLTVFGMQNFFILCGTIIGVACGDAVWRARHEAYEARHIGRYRLKERIGRGGMGEVWLAHHLGLRQDVALKVLTYRNNDADDALARFEREVRAITRLTHPNTVRILDFGATPDGIWFYAMELLQGCDLAALVEREGALDASRALGLIEQASHALAEAHRSGVIHRDIKPGNIFVATVAGQPDFVKVLDFGIVKLMHDPARTQLTRDGSLLGTPRYMAPEALAGGDADARSDVYALGCVLYELLAGVPPFTEDALPMLLRQHEQGCPPPPSHKRGEPLPAQLEAAVMRCLEPRPDDRYADAGLLACALAECRSSLELTPSELERRR
jgi:hypothetical protein